MISYFTSCCHFAVCAVNPIVSHQTSWLTGQQKQHRGTQRGQVLQLDKSAREDEVSCKRQVLYRHTIGRGSVAVSRQGSSLSIHASQHGLDLIQLSLESFWEQCAVGSRRCRAKPACVD